jgi:hypothetical protein
MALGVLLSVQEALRVDRPFPKQLAWKTVSFLNRSVWSPDSSGTLTAGGLHACYGCLIWARPETSRHSDSMWIGPTCGQQCRHSIHAATSCHDRVQSKGTVNLDCRAARDSVGNSTGHRRGCSADRFVAVPKQDGDTVSMTERKRIDLDSLNNLLRQLKQLSQWNRVFGDRIRDSRSGREGPNGSRPGSCSNGCSVQCNSHLNFVLSFCGRMSVTFILDWTDIWESEKRFTRLAGNALTSRQVPIRRLWICRGSKVIPQSNVMLGVRLTLSAIGRKFATFTASAALSQFQTCSPNRGHTHISHTCLIDIAEWS